MHHNARGYDFLWFPASVCVFFFYIKFYVSLSLSYCWAIRPPPSFSFFLCPFSPHPLPLPPLWLYLFFCLFLSVSLSALSVPFSVRLSPAAFLFHCLFPVFYLSDFLSLSRFVSLSPSSQPPPLSPVSLLCLLTLSLKVLIADGSRALFTLSLLVSVSISGRSHSLSPRHTLPTAPRNKHTKWFPARAFCFRWGWRKREKNRGFM